MNNTEDIKRMEQELRDDPLFDLLRDNRPQPSREVPGTAELAEPPVPSLLRKRSGQS